MIVNKSGYRILLASRSPRRQQLLGEMGFKFDVMVREFDETYPDDLTGKQIAEYIAEKKAGTFISELADNEIVITADTVVWCKDHVLGKPSDTGEAIEMLMEISGNTHEVITGVSILSQKKKITFSETTRVTFEDMTEEEIRYYIRNFKPFDKAGAYGIQEWIGIIGCSRIEGSYFNVVGLPVHRLYNELKKIM